MGSSTFRLFNVAGANMDTDSQYATDSFRTGGATTGGECPALTANKLWYQLSIGVAALMQMMATKGYTVSDGNPPTTTPTTALNNLAAVLANIRTVADGNAVVQNVASSGTVPTGFYWLVEDATTSAITRTLFSAVGNGNAQYTLKNSSGGSITLAPHAGESIDGSTSSITVPNGFGTTSSITIISNGTGWLIIG